MKRFKKYQWLVLLFTLMACSEGDSQLAILENCENTETKEIVAEKCCKICKKGKACGDSCINKQLTCHKKPGCACDG
jgi:hypothetical protein